MPALLRQSPRVLQGNACVRLTPHHQQDLAGPEAEIPQDIPEHAEAMGQHAWILTSHCQWDLVSVPHRNSLEWSQVAKSVHRHKGEETQGIQLYQSRSCLECTLNPPLAHYPPLASKEPIDVHLRSPPMGPQGCTSWTTT